MAARRPLPSCRRLFERVGRTIRATERTLQGMDLTLEKVRDAAYTVSTCRIQLERVLAMAVENQIGQALLENIHKYEGFLHQEEVKILQSGECRTQYQASRLSTGARGSPKFCITRRQLELLIMINCSTSMIAKTLGVSLSTVKRRMHEYRIILGSKFSQMSDADLDDLVQNITEYNMNLGYRSVQAQLQSQGLLVQETRIRASMERVNSAGIAMRWGNTVQRRVYRVSTPNALWHIDGNHKLIRWKIVIHGGIDGYSRMVVFLKASANNYARTVLSAFREATAKFGVPSRVRMDHGVENVGVVQFMEQENGTGRGSAIQGRSVHNQRIERLWLDVFQAVNHKFRTVFTLLELMGLLDVDSDIHMYCLHYVYLLRVQENLDAFRQRYNCHSLSTEHNRTPQQLFAIGTLTHLNSSHRGITGQRNLLRVDHTDDVDLEEQPEPGDDDPTADVPPVNCPLSDRYQQQLHQEIPPQNPDDPLGVHTYKRVLEFVANHIN